MMGFAFKSVEAGLFFATNNTDLTVSFVVPWVVVPRSAAATNLNPVVGSGGGGMPFRAREIDS